jgi:hypothetical protein
MQTLSRTAAPPIAITPRVTGDRRFDLAVVLLSGWVTVGAYTDAWAHHNAPGLEKFFTPWHGLLYSGFLALSGFLLATIARHRAAGRAMPETLPQGYELAPLGMLLFAAGGVGDMLWHTAFGIEVGIEALLSPPHLLLAAGIALLVGAPARAYWRETPIATGRRERLPALLSLALTLAALTFFSEYANPFSQPWAAAGAQTTPGELGQMLGVTAVLLQAGLLMGTILLALRLGLLFDGALTILLTLTTALAVSPHEEFRFVPVGVLAGALADLLLRWQRPARSRPAALRRFAFAVPALLFAAYFAALGLTGGIGWSLPLWSGTILLAGVVGWLLSYLLLPPDTTSRADAEGW